ncbi:hypothetical protein [Oleiharenicola sp. Vm1]|uniref:hypothetical protein n=1 Tax=Oleiharenicola sp. Vm1 TaxID=3398393 RepID=UPI0039F61AE7
MTKNKLELVATLLALGAGALDFGTGLGLVAAPGLMLQLMGAGALAAEPTIYLRWIGAFVAAVGFNYLWALWRRDVALLRHVLELTIFFRLAAGAYSAWAVASGALPLAWVSVPLTDFFLAATQTWLVRRGVFATAR